MIGAEVRTFVLMSGPKTVCPVRLVMTMGAYAPLTGLHLDANLNTAFSSQEKKPHP